MANGTVETVTAQGESAVSHINNALQILMTPYATAGRLTATGDDRKFHSYTAEQVAAVQARLVKALVAHQDATSRLKALNGVCMGTVGTPAPYQLDDERRQALAGDVLEAP